MVAKILARLLRSDEPTHRGLRSVGDEIAIPDQTPMFDPPNQRGMRRNRPLRPKRSPPIGIVRSRTGATAEEAVERLKRMSQSENVKLVVVAERLVDEAVRRARARHAP